MLLYAWVLRFPCRRHHHRGHRHPSQLNKLLWGWGRGGVGGGGDLLVARAEDRALQLAVHDALQPGQRALDQHLPGRVSEYLPWRGRCLWGH